MLFKHTFLPKNLYSNGSGAMSGTKLTPNRALANARLGTIKVNTQFGCRPNWVLANAQLGLLTPNSET